MRNRQLAQRVGSTALGGRKVPRTLSCGRLRGSPGLSLGRGLEPPVGTWGHGSAIAPSSELLDNGGALGVTRGSRVLHRDCAREVLTSMLLMGRLRITSEGGALTARSGG